MASVRRTGRCDRSPPAVTKAPGYRLSSTIRDFSAVDHPRRCSGLVRTATVDMYEPADWPLDVLTSHADALTRKWPSPDACVARTFQYVDLREMWWSSLTSLNLDAGERYSEGIQQWNAVLDEKCPEIALVRSRHSRSVIRIGVHVELHQWLIGLLGVRYELVMRHEPGGISGQMHKADQRGRTFSGKPKIELQGPSATSPFWLFIRLYLDSHRSLSARRKENEVDPGIGRHRGRVYSLLQKLILN